MMQARWQHLGFATPHVGAYKQAVKQELRNSTYGESSCKASGLTSTKLKEILFPKQDCKADFPGNK